MIGIASGYILLTIELILLGLVIVTILKWEKKKVRIWREGQARAEADERKLIDTLYNEWDHYSNGPHREVLLTRIARHILECEATDHTKASDKLIDTLHTADLMAVGRMIEGAFNKTGDANAKH